MSLLEGGLNDNVLDDLNPTDGITPPSATDDNKPVVIVDPEKPDAEVDMTATIEQLDGFNTKLVSLQGDVAHVHDLETVVSQIMVAESISASDIEDVEHVLPEITTEVADKRTFTELPSKTNLVEVQRYVAEKLDEERKATLGEIKEFLETTYGPVLRVSHTDLKNSVHEGLLALQRTGLRDLPIAVASNKFMVTDPSIEEGSAKFINLAKMPLSKWKERERYLDAFESFPHYAVSNGLHHALENPYFTAFYDSLESGDDCSFSFLRKIASVTDTRESGTSYIDALAMFSRGHLADKLVELDEYIEMCRGRIINDIAKLDGTECEKSATILTDLFEFSERYYAYLQLVVAIKAIVGYSNKLFEVMAKNF